MTDHACPKNQKAAREAASEELRREITVGLDQAERGELYEGEEVFRELEERLGQD